MVSPRRRAAVSGVRPRSALGAAIAIAVTLFVAPPADAAPNVVLIVTDDQRVGTLSPERTPAIWRLLRERGVRFTDANVPTSLCCPSRASILTGLYSHSHGVWTNGAVFGGWNVFSGNGMEERTIAVALDDAGYRTALLGKYLNGSKGGSPVGWDVYREVGAGYRVNNRYATDYLRDRATGFIRSTPRGVPFFLYFSPFAPHAPAVPARRHALRFERLGPAKLPPSFTELMADKPPWLRGRGTVSLAKYLGTLRRKARSMLAVDEAVAAIVGELRRSDRLGNTLIVFMSDNGILLGEHRLRTVKGLPYRMATRIPMLARFDGRLPAGRDDGRLVLNVDVPTTIAAAAGVPFRTEGINLLSVESRLGFVLEGKGPSTKKVVAPSYCGYRSKRYMYAYYQGGFEELYDYRLDPHELANRAKDNRYRERKAALRQYAFRECKPTPPGFSWR